MDNILAKALQLFLVLDPLGNVGIIATLIATFPKERQHKILLRELSFAFLILVIMLFMGSYLLSALGVSQAAVTITGGIIFFLFALSLLFPGSNSVMKIKNLSEEPFIVPIATPLVVGPSSTATVILFSHDPNMSSLSSLIVVIIAWGASAIIIISGPLLLDKLGKTGSIVMERLIGMICTLIAVKMILAGLKSFLASLN